jgi:prepilin signal peptidase PulO-like enzyme (type II secretory pathway)
MMLTVFGMVLTALAFAAFAYAGALAARTYWAMVPRLADSPEPQVPPVAILVCAAAVIGALCALRGAPSGTLAIVGAMAGLLTAVWCVDTTRGIVPDVLTLVPLAALLVAGLLTGRWYVVLAAAVPAVPFAVMAWRTKGLGLGWGDVKLVALGGALLGMQTAILAFALAAVGAIVVARIRRRTTEPLAFGPYLVTAIAVPLALVAGL